MDLERALAEHERWLASAGADGSQLSLDEAVIGPRDLAGRDLREVMLWTCDLRGARLAGALFLRATLNESRFDEADLTEADLFKAEAESAVFIRARLVRIRGLRADFSSADFTDADLSVADLSHAYLNDTVFDRADLRGASVEGAGIQRARFAGTLLTGLRGIDAAHVGSLDPGDGKLLEGEAARDWLRGRSAALTA